MIFSIERLNDRFDEKEKWLGGDREKLVENYGGRRGGEGKVFTSGLTWNPINVSIATWPYRKLGRGSTGMINARAD